MHQATCTSPAQRSGVLGSAAPETHDGLANVHLSLSIGSRVHQHPAPAWRRPEPLRARLGAVEPDPERGEDTDQRRQHAGRAQRREPCQR